VRHLLEPADTVVLVDRVGPVDHRADVLLPGPDIRAAVASAAMVVLALPEDVALRCLAWLPMTVRADAVLVSTCSVQEPLFAEIDAGEQSPQLLGVNPMFAPTLASRGRPVALISRAPGPEVERLRRRLDEDGMVVTELTPHAHDLVMSHLQTLPHAAVLAFLGVLTDAPVDLPALLALAPPPARTLIALGCRILSAPPETYWDIQRAIAT